MVRRWAAILSAVALVGWLAATRLPAGADEVSYSMALAQLGDLDSMVAATPDRFAGIYADEGSRTITVRYPAAAGPQPARDRLSQFARTAATATSWRVRLAEAVVVGLTGVTPAAQRAASARFGDRVRLKVTGRTRFQSRARDFPPWSGGIVLATSLGACSSAFAIRNDDNPLAQQLLTAAHCVGPDDVVTNNGQFVGTVVRQDESSGGLDVAYLAGSSYSSL